MSGWTQVSSGESAVQGVGVWETMTQLGPQAASLLFPAAIQMAGPLLQRLELGTGAGGEAVGGQWLLRVSCKTPPPGQV